MEPFTLEEERGLVDKLEALSVGSLESYIASTRAALASNALAATWRTRIALGARHAEQALTKARAAAALAELSAPPEVPVTAPKSKKAAALVPVQDSEQSDD